MTSIFFSNNIQIFRNKIKVSRWNHSRSFDKPRRPDPRRKSKRCPTPSKSKNFLTPENGGILDRWVVCSDGTNFNTNEI